MHPRSMPFAQACIASETMCVRVLTGLASVDERAAKACASVQQSAGAVIAVVRFHSPFLPFEVLVIARLTLFLHPDCSVHRIARRVSGAEMISAGMTSTSSATSRWRACHRHCSVAQGWQITCASTKTTTSDLYTPPALHPPTRVADCGRRLTSRR